MWLADLGRSFRCAWRGIVRSVQSERNLRIHLAAAFYATAAGFLAGLDLVQWGLLLLCIGAVLRAELINTAFEELCDVLHPSQHPKIGAAKDAAAGSVLVLAMAAVGLGAVLFGPWLLEGGLGAALREQTWLVPGFAISLPIAIFWIKGGKKWN